MARVPLNTHFAPHERRLSCGHLLTHNAAVMRSTCQDHRTFLDALEGSATYLGVRGHHAPPEGAYPRALVLHLSHRRAAELCCGCSVSFDGIRPILAIHSPQARGRSTSNE